MHTLHQTRAERLCHQPPQACVIGSVAIEDYSLEEAVRRAVADTEFMVFRRVFMAQPAISKQRHHIGVPADHPLTRAAPAQWPRGAQFRIHGVRIGQHFRGA
ncbi:hypothetical protein [Streptomyces sp. NPDC059819]|uniref:hypothetical protein n=1 Tax=Streptomyces sp. NPDC059819 TaxID=3346963 RepID=UPI0036694B30